jgi:hypothetical protein
MKIAALSILAGFTTVVTSIRSMESMDLDDRIDWGNSDPKGIVQLKSFHN